MMSRELIMRVRGMTNRVENRQTFYYMIAPLCISEFDAHLKVLSAMTLQIALVDFQYNTVAYCTDCRLQNNTAFYEEYSEVTPISHSYRIF